MTEYCEICGAELDSDEEEDGICKSCKNPDYEEEEEDYVDPAIT